MRKLIEQEVDDEAAYAAFDCVEKHAEELFKAIPEVGKVCMHIFKDQIPRILKVVDDRDEREDVEGPGVCDVIFGLHFIYMAATHSITNYDVKAEGGLYAALSKMAEKYEREIEQERQLK